MKCCDDDDYYYFLCYMLSIRHAAGFSSEADVENFFTEQKSLIALGAVVFDKESFDGDNVRSGTTITYKIRLRAEQYAGTYKSGSGSGDTVAPSTRWQTSHMFPRRPSVGPQGDLYGGQTPGWYENINSDLSILHLVLLMLP